MANMLEFVVGMADVSICQTVHLKLQDVARSRILDATHHGVSARNFSLRFWGLHSLTLRKAVAVHSFHN